MLKAIETIYQGYCFRSRIEARWAIVFDELGLTWQYEPDYFSLGLKYDWSLYDEEEYDERLNDAWDEDERSEIRRKRWWHQHEKLMYLPDFWIDDFGGCWIEIKGKSPTHEERTKARRLSSRTTAPVHILWGNIPDPNAPTWGENADCYGAEMNIIAQFVIEMGMRQTQEAFFKARSARFEHGESGGS